MTSDAVVESIMQVAKQPRGDDWRLCRWAIDHDAQIMQATLTALRTMFKQEKPTFVAYVRDLCLRPHYEGQKQRFAEAERAIEDYEAARKGAKPLPVGIRVVYAFLGRNHIKREEKALARAWQVAKDGLDNVTSGEWLKSELKKHYIIGPMAGPQAVYRARWGYFSPKDESDARKLTVGSL